MTEIEVSIRFLKEVLAHKICRCIADQKEGMLDSFGNDMILEPSVNDNEGKQDELFEWADKFIDSVAESAVRTCLKV